MPDLEKVIKGLEHCGSADMCDKCPYLVKDIENAENRADDAGGGDTMNQIPTEAQEQTTLFE